LICGKDHNLLNVSTGGGKRSTKSCVVDFIIVLLGEFALLVAAAPADAVDDPVQNARHLTVFCELATAAESAFDDAILLVLSFHIVVPSFAVENEQLCSQNADTCWTDNVVDANPNIAIRIHNVTS
jgi:hypothetical protein